MDEGVRRAANNESYFSVGLRGLGDEAANTENAITMLEDVFTTQRGIIKKYHGTETAVNRKSEANTTIFLGITDSCQRGLGPLQGGGVVLRRRP